MEKLELIEEHSQDLEKLRSERQALNEELYKGLEKFDNLFQKLDSETAEEAGKEVSKLEATIRGYGTFNQTIAELAEGLTENLALYVQFASESQNYQGKEAWLARFGLKKRADKLRIQRLRTQSPKENLQQILEYAQQLVTEICSVREDAHLQLNKLIANTRVITEKIAEYEPREAELKQKLDELEATYKEVNDAFKKASAQEQVEHLEKREELSRQLMTLRNEYGQVFTIYKQAQEALEPSRTVRASFEKMVHDLGRQATMIKEKVDNVTEIYYSAPEAVKVMMTTRGMESTDKALNAATAESVDLSTRAAEAVGSATLDRETVQLIDPEVMAIYVTRLSKAIEESNRRFEEIRAVAQQSVSERYGID
jgi:chromosome segregation ATPase